MFYRSNAHIVSVRYPRVDVFNTGKFQARLDLAAFLFPPSVCLSDALADSVLTLGPWNTRPRVGSTRFNTSPEYIDLRPRPDGCNSDTGYNVKVDSRGCKTTKQTECECCADCSPNAEFIQTLSRFARQGVLSYNCPIYSNHFTQSRHHA